MNSITVCILTVSDRSFQKMREDISGPKLKEYIEHKGWQVLDRKIVPDEPQQIQKTLKDWCRSVNSPHVILTTGGTGFAPRDVTPEATRKVIEKEAPGLAEVMRFKGLDTSPFSMLSRGTAGICGKTIIINLPGSPKAAIECVSSIVDLLPHAISLLTEEPEAEKQHK
jgi:molybdopterin adenylyltransferase